MTTAFIVFQSLTRDWAWPEGEPSSVSWIGAGGWPDPEMPRETQWLIRDAAQVEAFTIWAEMALGILIQQGHIGPKCRVIIAD